MAHDHPTIIATAPTVAKKLHGFDLYRHLGSPKLIVAPMVDQSELAYRILCRRFGAQLAYTPMINSKTFSLANAKFMTRNFDLASNEEGNPDVDRPLIVQFCGNKPEELLASAKLVEHRCDAVDINLGCPQEIARRGHYGSWLQDEWDLVYKLVNTLHENLSVPVTAKFRIFANVERSIEYARMLERAGAQILTIHGRTREQRGVNTSMADWKQIALIKRAVSIPVFANGNILYGEDVERCLAATGADGVMSAEGILYNTALFSQSQSSTATALPEHYSCTRIALDYLDIVRSLKTHTGFSAIKGHLFKILRHALERHTDLRAKMGQAKVLDVGKGRWTEESLQAYVDIINELDERLKIDAQNNTASIELNRETGLRRIPWWLSQPYVRLPPVEGAIEVCGAPA
ncbi:Dus-domain-containing protein [Fistulina hepatica ATCC 64428]|uniref:tRNA-dihydrouridine(16/17) synthase [NAD(P)(+)] n=1 Tax=Fistulina hepatica ATCC 64428 TaxID=1128425 RepID=A0A0D7AFQ8_9AGAR|nr:Dus-domain-containing protein [Fistulina hepatica ATCC 64428]